MAYDGDGNRIVQLNYNLHTDDDWKGNSSNGNGDMTSGKPQYNNVYGYNAESYNPNMESQYLRARYYNVPNGNSLT